jgi:zinc protease
MKNTSRMNSSFASVLVSFLLVIYTVGGADALQPDRASPATSFMLDNGMQVVVIPDRRAPVVTHMVWYKVGGADEEPGKSGIAHFFEHLMFKATKNHASGEFSRAVAAIGGQENAFTTADYTAYFQQVDPSALGEMMAFESDRMINLILTDDVVATERAVILEERNSRVENDPGSLLNEEVMATVYQNHPYGTPVIGWQHEIEQLNLTDAEAFYQRFYAPNNAILIVAGDVEIDAVRKLAEETYGKLPRGPELPERNRPTEPFQNTDRTVTLHDPRVTEPSFGKIWLVPSYLTAQPGEAEAIDLLSEILGGGLRSRLYQELVVKQGIAAGTGISYQGDNRDRTMFIAWGQPRGEASLAELEAGVAAEVEKIKRDGVTPEELDAARQRFLRSVIFSRDSQSAMARIYGASLATGQTIDDIEQWPDRIRAVTPDDIKAVANRYLTDTGTVTSYLLPAAAAPATDAKAEAEQ